MRIQIRCFLDDWPLITCKFVLKNIGVWLSRLQNLRFSIWFYQDKNRHQFVESISGASMGLLTFRYDKTTATPDRMMSMSQMNNWWPLQPGVAKEPLDICAMPWEETCALVQRLPLWCQWVHFLADFFKQVLHALEKSHGKQQVSIHFLENAHSQLAPSPNNNLIY